MNTREELLLYTDSEELAEYLERFISIWNKGRNRRPEHDIRARHLEKLKSSVEQLQRSLGILNPDEVCDSTGLDDDEILDLRVTLERMKPYLELHQMPRNTKTLRNQSVLAWVATLWLKIKGEEPACYPDSKFVDAVNVVLRETGGEELTHGTIKKILFSEADG